MKNSINLFVLIVSLIFIVSCNKSSYYTNAVPPIADFTVSGVLNTQNPQINAGEVINYYDSSKYNPIKWLWIFENGTPSTSTNKNPNSILYSIPGKYTVKLTVTNPAGSNTMVKTNYITVVAKSVKDK